jgi:hypothetical protein
MQSPVRQQQRQVLLLAAGFEKRPVHHKVSATHLRLIDQLFGQISRCCPKAARHHQHFSMICSFEENQGLPKAGAKKKKTNLVMNEILRKNQLHGSKQTYHQLTFLQCLRS